LETNPFAGRNAMQRTRHVRCVTPPAAPIVAVPSLGRYACRANHLRHCGLRNRSTGTRNAKAVALQRKSVFSETNPFVSPTSIPMAGRVWRTPSAPESIDTRPWRVDPPRRPTPMNVIINGRQARRARRTGRTRRNLDGPGTPADRTRPARYAGWHDQPTPKALQRVARGKSRVIGSPPRVRSIADKANPVRVPHRTTITRGTHTGSTPSGLTGVLCHVTQGGARLRRSDPGLLS